MPIAVRHAASRVRAYTLMRCDGSRRFSCRRRAGYESPLTRWRKMARGTFRRYVGARRYVLIRRRRRSLLLEQPPRRHAAPH